MKQSRKNSKEQYQQQFLMSMNQSQMNQSMVNQNMQGFQQPQMQSMPVMNQMYIPQQMQYQPQMMMPQQVTQMIPQPPAMQQQQMPYMPQSQYMSYNEQLKMEEQILNDNGNQSKVNDQSLIDLENEVKQMESQNPQNIAPNASQVPTIDQDMLKPQFQQLNLQSQPQYQQPQFVFVQTPQGLMQVPVINQMGYNNQMYPQQMQPTQQQQPFMGYIDQRIGQQKKRSQTSNRPVKKPQKGHPLFTSTAMEETDAARKTQSSRGKSLKQMRVGLPHNDRYYNRSSDFEGAKSPGALRSKSPINQRSKSNKKSKKDQDTLSTSSRNNLNFMKATLSQQRKFSEKIKVRSQIKMQLKQLNQLQEKLVKQQDAIMKKKKEKKLLKKEMNHLKSRSPSKEVVKIINHKYIGGSSSERSDYRQKSRSQSKRSKSKSIKISSTVTPETFSPIKEKPPKLKLKYAEKKMSTPNQEQKDVLSKSPKSKRLKSKSSMKEMKESLQKSFKQNNKETSKFKRETDEVQNTVPEIDNFYEQQNKLEQKSTKKSSQRETLQVQMPQVSSNELSSRNKRKETIVITDDKQQTEHRNQEFIQEQQQIRHEEIPEPARGSQSKSSMVPSEKEFQRDYKSEQIDVITKEEKAQLMLQNIEKESEFLDYSQQHESPKKVNVTNCEPVKETIRIEGDFYQSFKTQAPSPKRQVDVEPVKTEVVETNLDLIIANEDIQGQVEESYKHSDDKLKKKKTKKDKKDKDSKKSKKLKKEITSIKLEDSINDEVIDKVVKEKALQDTIVDGFGEAMPLPAFEKIKKCRIELYQVETDSQDTEGWSSEIQHDQRFGSKMWSGMDDDYEEVSSSEGKQIKMSILDNPSSIIKSGQNSNSKKSSQRNSDFKFDTQKQHTLKQMSTKKSKALVNQSENDQSFYQEHPHFFPGQAVYTKDISDAMRITQESILTHVQEMQSLREKKFMIINSSGNPQYPGNYSYIQEYQEPVVVDVSNIIRINDRRMRYFEIFVIILAIYNCFGIPLEICFAPPLMQSNIFTFLNAVIDLFFAIDIYIQFKTSYYDDQSGEEIMDRQTIIWNYLSGRFFIDLMATIPFDSIAYMITRQKSAILPLFSLLKLIRVTRLGRIVEKMNVKEDIKLAMKLAQIIFFLIMFIHIQACVWFKIVQTDQTWQAPLDGIDPDSDLYSDSILRKYLISIYYSILLLTCNDITPQGDWKIFFCTAAITLGAIINAHIFGNMALIIQNLNIKSTEFQESIDLANTAMKNLNMPSNLQKDVVAYLQYTQESQNGQQEFVYFFQSLSPSLRNKVIDFLFKEKCQECELFQGSKPLIEFFIQNLDLRLLDPEYPLISEGEEGNMFFFVRSGDLDVFVIDPVKKKEVYVRTLMGGQFFGEFALLTGEPRSASVRPKSYAKVGYFNKLVFEEMVFMFPEFKQRLYDHMNGYDDVHKIWEREQLKRIVFMRYLSSEILDELTIIFVQKYYDMNEEILRHGQVCDKIIILTQGVIEIFVTISGENGPEELIMDTLKTPGCVLNQISMLNRFKLNYSARAKTDVETMVIYYDELTEQMEKTKMVGLKAAVEEFQRKIRDRKGSYPSGLSELNGRMHFLDYQKTFRTKLLKQKDVRIIFNNCIDKLCKLIRFHRKKDNILSDLIAELKKQDLEEKQRAQGKMKEVVKSVGPIIVQKLKKLVTNRIKQVYQDSQLQSQQINNISKIISMLENQGHQGNKQGQNANPQKKQRDEPEEFDMKPKNKIVIQPRMQEVKELDDEDGISLDEIPDSSRKLI